MVHAGVAYMTFRLPGLVWSTFDPVGDLTIDALIWWIGGFVMPLFFVLSGLLSCQNMKANGAQGFLKHRMHRLLVPMAAAFVVIMPFDLYALLLGWAGEGKITLHKLRSLKIDSPLSDGLWGPSHLWFMQHLILLCIGAWALASLSQWLKPRIKKLHWPAFLTPSHLTTWSLLAVSTAAMWWDPQVNIGFRHSWWPPLANFLFFAPWFAIGWLAGTKLDRTKSTSSSDSGDATREQHPGQTPFVRLCEVRLLASLGLFAFLLPMIREHVATGSSGYGRMALVTTYVLHMWLATTGWFGICLRWLKRPTPKPVKYLGEASFWVYLSHHPIVLLAHVSLSEVALPLSVKFVLVSTVGIVLPLLMYSAFISKTRLGALLGGGQRRKSSDDPPTVLVFPVHEPQPLKKSA